MKYLFGKLMKILKRIEKFKYQAMISDNQQFFFLQIFGLTIALLMWSISILGLHATLTVNSLLLLALLILTLMLFFYLKGKEDRPHQANLISCLLLCIGLIQFYAIYYVFKFPPFVWDEVAYGAALPKLYAEKKYFYYVANYGPYSAFPQNFEAISTASLILLNSFAGAKFLNLIFALCYLVMAGGIASLIGLPRIFALLSGALVGISSAFITFTPTIKNDIANGFFQSAAILMLILYSKNRTLQNSCLMGIFIGTSIGIKYNSLLLGICPILIFLWITLTSDELWFGKIKKIFVTGAFVLVASLPWYLNNFNLFHNPVYPIANEFFQAKNDFHSGYSQLFKESFYGDVNFSWVNGNVSAFFKRFLKEFNPILVIFGLFGLTKSILFGKNKQEIYLAIITLGSLILVIRFGFWEPRYSFFLLVMLAIHSAAFVYFICTPLLKFITFKKYQLVLSTVCIMCLLIISYKIGNEIYGAKSRHFQTHSEESFKKIYISGYNVASWLNQNTPTDSVVAVWGHQMFYYLDRPYFHIHPLTESGNLLGVKNEGEFYEFLINKKINYLSLADWRLDEVPSRNPGLKEFFFQLNTWVGALETQGKITSLSNIDRSTIYILNKK
jgi:hypothetical protein